MVFKEKRFRIRLRNTVGGGNPAKEGQIQQYVPKMMWDKSQYRQNGVGNIKMSLKLYRIHFKSRSKKPPVATIHIFAKFFEVQLGRHGGDKRRKERTTER